MKLSQFVFTFVCVASFCVAQTASSPPGGHGAAPAKFEDSEAAPPQQAPPVPSTASPAATSPKPPASSTAPEGPEKPDLGPPPSLKANVQPSEEGSVKPTYIIGPLDVLYVRVWNQPNLSGVTEVSPDGTISMQLVGVLKAEGLTVSDLEALVTRRLNDYINNPYVSITVSRINSKSVLLIGGVGHPGKFPLTEKTTVLDAIVGSGGLRDFANGKKIYILRNGTKIQFNYKDVIQGKHLEQNILLQNGDKVVVPE